jgi:YcxB-like protein
MSQDSFQSSPNAPLVQPSETRTIHFNQTVNDLVAFSQELTVKRFTPPEEQTASRPFRGWGILLWAGIFLLSCCIALLPEVRNTIAWFIPLLARIVLEGLIGLAILLGILAVSGFLKVSFKPVSQQLTEQFTQWLAAGRVNRMIGERTVTIAPEGVTTTSRVGTDFTSWAGVEDIVETPHCLFLYTDVNAAVCIPKDAFADEAERGTFLSLAKRYQEQYGPGAAELQKNRASAMRSSGADSTGIVAPSNALFSKDNPR